MPPRLLVILLGRLLPCFNPLRPLTCHYCRHLGDLPLANQQQSDTPWPAQVSTGSPATHDLLTSVACESSTSYSSRPSPTSATSTLVDSRPRVVPPDGNTRFAPGTLLLFEGALTFPHLRHDGPTPPATQQDKVTIAARRGRHGFTHATERTLQCQPFVPLTQRSQAPMPSWIRDSGRTSRMSVTFRLGQQACSPSLSTRRIANKPSRRTSMRRREAGHQPTCLFPARVWELLPCVHGMGTRML